MCTDEDLGFGLIERWHAAGEVVARGEPRVLPWQQRGELRSIVRAHPVWQHAHDGVDAFYAVENLYVDPLKRIRVRGAPTGGPNLAIERGTFRVACRPTAAWSTAPAPLTLASIRRALSFGPMPAAPIDDVPTLFVSRDGARNVFHAMADVFNAFLMRELFPYERIVFLDDHEDGPLRPLWNCLSPRILRFRELGSPRILSRVAFSPPGGCCFFWKNHWKARDECRHRSPLLGAFRDFILERLHLDRTPSSGRRITLIRRTRVSRRIANEEALVEALSALGAEVQVVDFAALPYKEQIATVLKTRVLLGAHGAGLINLLWLQDDATVVELYTDPNHVPACYGNLAAWRGVRWANWHIDASAPEFSRRGTTPDEVAVDVHAIAAVVAPLLA